MAWSAMLAFFSFFIMSLKEEASDVTDWSAALSSGSATTVDAIDVVSADETREVGSHEKSGESGWRIRGERTVRL